MHAFKIWGGYDFQANILDRDIPSIKWEDKVRALSDIQGPENLSLNPFFQEATGGENPL